jgi:hypothetical protein
VAQKTKKSERTETKKKQDKQKKKRMVLANRVMPVTMMKTMTKATQKKNQKHLSMTRMKRKRKQQKTVHDILGEKRMPMRARLTAQMLSLSVSPSSVVFSWLSNTSLK